MIDCPICKRPTHPLFEKYGYWIRYCQPCHYQFTEIDLPENYVDQTYDDHYFQGGQAGYPDYLAEASLLRKRGRWYAQMLRRYVKPGRVLDVGAAAGFILQGFYACGWEGRGIEPNAQMAYYAEKNLGVPVQVGTLEQFQDRDRYDLLTMIQVITHFHNLHQAFESAAHLTKPGGFWLIETWNMESCTAKTLGKNWHIYNPPSVLHLFSPIGLQKFARQFGFRKVAHGRPAKWINGAHAKSVLKYKLGSSPVGKTLFQMTQVVPDRLPIPYPAEDIFWILLQST
jgi:2-polyprenyl-3-methyl-5-hydroxy-6-metoxy-1,4-benzoquinol methylase